MDKKTKTRNKIIVSRLFLFAWLILLLMSCRENDFIADKYSEKLSAEEAGYLHTCRREYRDFGQRGKRFLYQTQRVAIKAKAIEADTESIEQACEKISPLLQDSGLPNNLLQLVPVVLQISNRIASLENTNNAERRRAIASLQQVANVTDSASSRLQNAARHISSLITAYRDIQADLEKVEEITVRLGQISPRYPDLKTLQDIRAETLSTIKRNFSLQSSQTIADHRFHDFLSAIRETAQSASGHLFHLESDLEKFEKAREGYECEMSKIEDQIALLITGVSLHRPNKSGPMVPPSKIKEKGRQPPTVEFQKNIEFLSETLKDMADHLEQLGDSRQDADRIIDEFPAHGSAFIDKASSVWPPESMLSLHQAVMDAAYIAKSGDKSKIRDACRMMQTEHTKFKKDLSKRERNQYSDNIEMSFHLGSALSVQYDGSFRVEPCIPLPIGSLAFSSSPPKGAMFLVVQYEGRKRWFRLDRSFSFYVPAEHGFRVSSPQEGIVVIEVSNAHQNHKAINKSHAVQGADGSTFSSDRSDIATRYHRTRHHRKGWESTVPRLRMCL